MKKAKVLLFGFGRMGNTSKVPWRNVDYSVVDPLINVVDDKFKNDFDLHQLGVLHMW